MFSEADIEAHRAAWRPKGALTGMVNWYRAVLTHRFKPESAYRITPPTLFIWGEHDAFGEASIGERSVAMCDNGRMVSLDASHWVQHDEPEKVSALILDHLRR